MFKYKYLYSNNFVYLIFLILLLIGCFTYRDYGIGIDDKFHRLNGFYWLDYLLSFTNFEQLKISTSLKLRSINDFTLPSITYYNSYSIIFDVPAALLEIIFEKDSPKEFYEFKHLLNFLFFLTSCIFFHKILRKRFSKKISLLGIILYIISPRIFGESFYNMKDIIFLTFIVIACYYCLKSFISLNYKNLIFLALFSSLCIQIRIFGLAIPLSFIIFYFLSTLAQPKYLKDLKKIFFFIFITSLFTYIFWPYLWGNPFENFFRLFVNIIPNVFILFNGEYINNNYLPYSYLPVWIFISTPVLHFILFTFGLFFLTKRIFKRLVSIKEHSISFDLWRGNKEKFDVFLALNFIILFVLVILLNVKLINTWKHLYFANFYLIYIASYYLNILDLKKLKLFKKKILYFIFLFFIFFTAYRMVIYHPYQGLYFNFLLTNNFKNKFEIDFTSLSARHFFDKIILNENGIDKVNIASASWTPLYRTLDIYTDIKHNINLVEQNYEIAKYIYTNNISEVDKGINNKYSIPSNFSKYYDFVIDGVVIYSIYKKNK